MDAQDLQLLRLPLSTASDSIDIDPRPATHDAIAVRPAVQRGVAVLSDNQRKTPITDAEREVMFGKTQFAAR